MLVCFELLHACMQSCPCTLGVGTSGVSAAAWLKGAGLSSGLRLQYIWFGFTGEFARGKGALLGP